MRTFFAFWTTLTHRRLACVNLVVVAALVAQAKFQQRLAMELLSMRLKVGAVPWGEEMEDRSKVGGAAPYACPDCGKTYMWKQGLNTHKRLHCGKEPRFQCPHCPKRCYQRGNLDSHIRNVHMLPILKMKRCVGHLSRLR